MVAPDICLKFCVKRDVRKTSCTSAATIVYEYVQDKEGGPDHAVCPGHLSSVNVQFNS